MMSRSLGTVLLVCLAVAAAAPLAAAHAILLRSSIADVPVTPEAPASVTLQFNAGIEVKLSKVLLVNARHEERPLAVGPGRGAGELTVDVPALTPGAYGLRYRVLAADGHLTDGVVRFTVAAAR